MYASSFTLLDLSSKEQMVGSLLPGVDVTLTVQWKITEAPKLAQSLTDLSGIPKVRSPADCL